MGIRDFREPFIGLIVGLVFTVWSLFLGVFSPTIFVVILCILLPTVSGILSFSAPEHWWKSALFVTFPYLLAVGYYISNTLSENTEYEGMFWTTQISFVSILLYSSVIILTLLAARVGSKPGLGSILYLLAGLAAIIAANVYAIWAWEPVEKKASASFQLIDVPELSVQADVECESSRYFDYWRFRKFDEGNYGSTKIVILSREPDLRLPTEMEWNIDGTTEIVGAMPMNTLTGFVATADSGDGTNLPDWGTQIPVQKIIKANKVSLTWGQITEKLKETQLESFVHLADSCRQ